MTPRRAWGMLLTQHNRGAFRCPLKQPRSLPRFYYGWIIVFAAAVKGAFNVGSAVFASSVFLVSMQEDLGWSRTLIFGALAVRTLAGGLLSPIVGPWGDHPWAPRVALPIGSVLFGLSFMLVKWADSPLEYYLKLRRPRRGRIGADQQSHP